jgi:chemotaxis signal transduction protein
MANDSIRDEVDGHDLTREVRLMFAGSQCIGLFADEIEAIADWRAPTPLPNAPAGVLGVACIRGRMLTVLEASVLLGAGATNERGKVLSLRGDEQIGLAVERTGDVVRIAADEIKPAAEMNSLVLGVVSHDGQSIAVLDSSQLFATAMRGRERRRRHF